MLSLGPGPEQGRDPVGLEETRVAKSLGIGPSRCLLGSTAETFLCGLGGTEDGWEGLGVWCGGGHGQDCKGAEHVAELPVARAAPSVRPGCAGLEHSFCFRCGCEGRVGSGLGGGRAVLFSRSDPALASCPLRSHSA